MISPPTGDGPARPIRDSFLSTEGSADRIWSSTQITTAVIITGTSRARDVGRTNWWKKTFLGPSLLRPPDRRPRRTAVYFSVLSLYPLDNIIRYVQTHVYIYTGANTSYGYGTVFETFPKTETPRGCCAPNYPLVTKFGSSVCRVKSN